MWLAHVGEYATPIYATPTSTSLVTNRGHCTTQNIAEGLFLGWIQIIDTCFKHLAVSLKKKIVKIKIYPVFYTVRLSVDAGEMITSA